MFVKGNTLAFMRTTSAAEAAALGLDFHVGNNLGAVCMMEELGGSVLATRVVTAPAGNVTSYASTIVALANNTRMKTMADVRGSIVSSQPFGTVGA